MLTSYIGDADNGAQTVPVLPVFERDEKAAFELDLAILTWCKVELSSYGVDLASWENNGTAITASRYSGIDGG
jgi:hypothetical protein